MPQTRHSENVICQSSWKPALWDSRTQNSASAACRHWNGCCLGCSATASSRKALARPLIPSSCCPTRQPNCHFPAPGSTLRSWFLMSNTPGPPFPFCGTLNLLPRESECLCARAGHRIHSWCWRFISWALTYSGPSWCLLASHRWTNSCYPQNNPKTERPLLWCLSDRCGVWGTEKWSDLPWVTQ